jgi:hypothetical protein
VDSNSLQGFFTADFFMADKLSDVSPELYNKTLRPFHLRKWREALTAYNAKSSKV